MPGEKAASPAKQPARCDLKGTTIHNNPTREQATTRPSPNDYSATV
jgi:hypothetical protein